MKDITLICIDSHYCRCLCQGHSMLLRVVNVSFLELYNNKYHQPNVLTGTIDGTLTLLQYKSGRAYPVLYHSDISCLHGRPTDWIALFCHLEFDYLPTDRKDSYAQDKTTLSLGWKYDTGNYRLAETVRDIHINNRKSVTPKLILIDGLTEIWQTKYIFCFKFHWISSPALVYIMTWCRTGDKPLSEAMTPYFTNMFIRHSA